MQDDKKAMQMRFLTATILSLGVFFLWTYLFPPPKPTTNNTNTAVVSSQASANNPSQNVSDASNTTANATPDNVPSRVISIVTPLYEAKFDSRGAVATNWILKKNVSSHGEKNLYSAIGSAQNPQPLDLISDKARETRELPFRLMTGDASFDSVLNERNFEVVSVDGGERVEVNGAESKKIEFLLRDANGVEALKSFTFYADRYVTDLQIRLTRGGQPLPNVKLAIGSSIGDKDVPHYTTYNIEPEAVAVTDGSIERHHALSFVGKSGTGNVSVNKTTDWAGVGDTYFAMLAVPAQPVNGFEVQSKAYEQAVAPYYDGIFSRVSGSQKTSETRHLTSVLLPIPTAGETNKIYVGTKDPFLLSEVNKNLTAEVGRAIDVEDVVNYSNYRILRALVKPLAVPILWSINKLYAISGNYGIAIILFTILFYSILFPMRWYQSRSFKQAAKNQPKMAELREKFEEMKQKGVPLDDPRMRELQLEQFRLTKSALPLGGCLPMLLQFPLLIALYCAITVSIDFRQASFAWLPDLSLADPYHLLEFLFAGSMWASMKFSPTAPAVSPEQQMQQKMMQWLMPLMMLWVMWGAPSGLLLYWFTGNVVGFIQQLIINRMNSSNEPPASVETGDDINFKNAKHVKSGVSAS